MPLREPLIDLCRRGLGFGLKSALRSLLWFVDVREGLKGGDASAWMERQSWLGQSCARIERLAHDPPSGTGSSFKDDAFGIGEDLPHIAGGEVECRISPVPAFSELEDGLGLQVAVTRSGNKFGGEVRVGFREDGSQFLIAHGNQGVSSTLEIFPLMLPCGAGKSGWDMDEQNPFPMVEVLLDRDSVFEDPVQAGLRFAGFWKGGCADDVTWSLVGDTQDDGASEFVGECDAVVNQFVEFITRPSRLELQPRSLR